MKHRCKFTDAVGKTAELWHEVANFTCARRQHESQTEAATDKWPDGARIAITPCVAFETWPEDLGGPNTLQQENRAASPETPSRKETGDITDREFGERVGIYGCSKYRDGENPNELFPTGITVQNYRRFSKKSPSRDMKSARKPGSTIIAT